MKTVRLYGHLGKNFGRVHHLDVSTPAEAIRALCANYKKFRQYIIENSRPGYRILTGKTERGLEEIHVTTSFNEIKIVPVVQGAGGSFGKIALGAALIGASFFLPGATYFSTMSSLSINASAIASSLGFSLVLGGLSQMLFKPPSQSQKEVERPNNRPSYAFNGAVNTVGQGNPVPICYGQCLVGSQVVSAGLSVDDIPV